MENNVIEALAAMERKNFNWTDANLRDEIALADGLEIAGVTDVDGETCERCDDAELADFFSVYIHYDPNNGSGNFGANCIADRNTYVEALAFAQELSKEFSLPIRDFT